MSQRKGLSFPESSAGAIAGEGTAATVLTALDDAERRKDGRGNDEKSTAIATRGRAAGPAVHSPRNAESHHVSPVAESVAVPSLDRRDGRTFRARRPTADLTTVTSMRLNTETMDRLEVYCWRHKARRQDVVDAALALYFASLAEEGEEIAEDA